MTRRFRMVVAYDGTDFCGFQRQPHGCSVQGVLEQALSRLYGHPIEVTGAGRTDAGVHSVGQVVHWESGAPVPVDRVAPVLNECLAPAIVVQAVEGAGPEFHARFSAVRRVYRYYLCRERPSPFRARYVVLAGDLRGDAVELMKAALAQVLGRRDFGALCRKRSDHRSTVRTLFHGCVEQNGADLRVELAADAFLRSMVRLLVGGLLEIGRGRREPGALAEALKREAPRGIHWMPAAAQGLFLTRVEYPDGYPPPHTVRQGGWDEDFYG